MEKNTLLLGTRKGLVVYRRNSNGWQFQKLHFKGIPVSLACTDHLHGTWWACLDHGHWGCKLHRSTDRGESWTELEAPKFPEDEMIKDNEPAVVKYLWAFSEGSNGNPDQIFLGTEPGGLFTSKNNGKTFDLVRGLWDHPSRKDNWFGGGRSYPGIHSIIIDPRDEKHIYVGISVAGVFETKDGGETWDPKNNGLKADFLPDPNAEIGHDPHLLVMSPSNPDVLWQQNHCGIFRSTDGGNNWTEVSQPDGPAKFGFAIHVDEKDPEIAWVVPAISDELRVAVDDALVVCRTTDGGKTWEELRNGLPQEHCMDIVYRHALDGNGDRLAFGTTTGNLFFSPDRGNSWECLNNYLPMIYSVEFAE